MRRSSEFERPEEEAVLCFDLLFRQAQEPERLALESRVADSDASASEFDSIEHQVVGPCPSSLGLVLE